MSRVEAILAQYDQSKELLEQFGSYLHDELKTMLQGAGIENQAVDSRIKTRDSLEKKIRSRGQNFTSLSEVQDVCGLRVVTFFLDDIDAVAELVGKRFAVDEAEDKKALLDPDRFGYLSRHFTISLPKDERPPSKGFFEHCAEIQVRSILQHAWAEIEHDLGYKSRISIPGEQRRQFSRLAGLLELADGEFSNIRQSLREYGSAIGHRIRESPKDVLIDKISLSELIQNDPEVTAIDAEIAALGEAEIVFEETAVDELVDELAVVRFESILDLRHALMENKPVILAIARSFFSKEEYPTLAKGISLALLIYAILATERTHEDLLTHLRKHDSGSRIAPEARADLIWAIVRDR